MTVPVRATPVADEYVCNGVPTVSIGGWVDPVGSTPANNNVNSLKRKETDLSKSIVLGYFTMSHYEGAILKADMTTQPQR